MIRLVLGGDKSGKSAYALDWFVQAPAPHLLLATGQAMDFSFRQQILDHRTARHPSIPVRETGVELIAALHDAQGQAASVLVDSLDFWLFSCLEQGKNGYIDALVDCLIGMKEGMVVTLVSCEAGLGPVPASSTVRQFVRSLGALNQTVAKICDDVHMMVAGMPLVLKGVQPVPCRKTQADTAGN